MANSDGNENLYLVQAVEEQKLLFEQAAKKMSRQSESLIPVDLSGLPWRVEKYEIEDFLDGVNVRNILIVLNDHRKPSGDARVWVTSETDAEKAVRLSGRNLGSRRIVVTKGWSDNASHHQPGDYQVDVKRLPWTVKNREIQDLLFGCNIKRIDIHRDMDDRATGDASVDLNTYADVENALKFQKQEVGGRNVDIVYYGSPPLTQVQQSRQPDPQHQEIRRPEVQQPQQQSSSSPLIAIDLHELPWSAKEEEIKDFFPDVNIAKVLIVLNDNRKPSGDARIWVQDSGDVPKVKSKNGLDFGTRKIRVTQRKANPENDAGERKIRLERLPWSVTEEQIRKFLFGSEVVSINIEMDDRGRPSGDALVTVKSKVDLDNALKFHKQEIGNRNVNVREM